MISYGIVIYVITLKKVWIVMLVVPGTDRFPPEFRTYSIESILWSKVRTGSDFGSNENELISIKPLDWAFLVCQHPISISVENWPIRHQRISVQHLCCLQWILLGSSSQRFTKSLIYTLEWYGAQFFWSVPLFWVLFYWYLPKKISKDRNKIILLLLKIIKRLQNELF